MNTLANSVDFDYQNALKVTGRQTSQGVDAQQSPTPKLQAVEDILVHEVNDDYVYRGPKNRTGIFKNSLVLKDLTGYVEEPEQLNQSITLDAGTQTVLHEEEPTIKESSKTGDLAVSNIKVSRTQEVTPKKKSKRNVKHGIRQNSDEGSNIHNSLGRDSELDRLDREAQSMRQNTNVTNQISHQYFIQGKQSKQQTGVKGDYDNQLSVQNVDDGLSTADLQA